MSRTPEELLALMQSGDMLALDSLARTYGAKLLAVARRRCHLEADAEDAVQQALVAASTAMRGIRGEGAPIAWLSTLVARSCSRLNAQADRSEALGVEPCTCEDPSAAAERRQLAQQLSAALMALNRTDRLLFLLATEGFDSVELAQRFGLTHDAVRGRLKRARRRLRLALGAGDTQRALPGTAAVNPSPESPRHVHDAPAKHR